MMLVTLDQGKSHLNVDLDLTAQDADITLKIHAASSAVINYLKSGKAIFLNSQGDLAIDSKGDPVGVPFEVQAATLLMLGFLYKDRDENAEGAFERGYLPMPVTALLYPLRDPAFA